MDQSYRNRSSRGTLIKGAAATGLATLLAGAGATSPHTQFYFPRATFTRMGTSTDPDTFLGVLDQLETASVGAYIAAVSDLASLRHVDLAGLAAGIAGVEAEHRMLG